LVAESPRGRHEVLDAGDAAPRLRLCFVGVSVRLSAVCGAVGDPLSSVGAPRNGKQWVAESPRGRHEVGYWMPAMPPQACVFEHVLCAVSLSSWAKDEAKQNVAAPYTWQAMPSQACGGVVIRSAVMRRSCGRKINTFEGVALSITRAPPYTPPGEHTQETDLVEVARVDLLHRRRCGRVVGKNP
jgi:hypothetical protein